MKKLMNSAMMPQGGYYAMNEVSKNEFINLWKSSGNAFDSSIGYLITAKFLARTLGEYIPINRVLTTLNDGDLIFVCKLNYRVIDPSDKKNQTPKDTDYMFFVGQYFTNYQSFVA